MTPIVKSFLDTDYYKLTMGQAVWDLFPGARATYHFVCRGGQKLGYLAPQIREQIQSFRATTITEVEAKWLAERPFRDDYINYLKEWAVGSHEVSIEVTDDNGYLSIIIEGPWKAAIYFEVPLLAIINELYYSERETGDDWNTGLRNLRETLRALKAGGGISFSDFGTRRRRHLNWHRKVLEECISGCCNDLIFSGTSNVKLAMEYFIPPVGTMAHEWIQAGQAFYHPLDAQGEMLLKWAEFYPKPLRIALTDTLGLDHFLMDFESDKENLFMEGLANCYAGVRQDSGDPIMWTDRMLAHYRALGLDPKDKMFVYSDCLDASKCLSIHHHLAGRAQASFGIGTNLTNDFADRAMQNVIKLVEVNGRPVAKISDTPGKAICGSEKYMAYLKEVLRCSNE
jgi:nicotinate phosphoribosyltransferase